MAPTDHDGLVQQVADFYTAYATAAAGGSTDAAAQLRSTYLTPGLQQSLADWGVFHGNGVPTSCECRYSESGQGHCVTLVTLTWGDGPDAKTSEIAVRSEQSTGLICDIQSR